MDKQKSQFNFLQYNEDINFQLGYINDNLKFYNDSNKDQRWRQERLSEVLDHLLRLFFGQHDEGSIIDKLIDKENPNKYSNFVTMEKQYKLGIHRRRIGESLRDNGLFGIIFENQALVKELIEDSIRKKAQHNRKIDVVKYKKDFYLRFGQFIRFCIDNDIDVQGLNNLVDENNVFQFGVNKKKSSSSSNKKSAKSDKISDKRSTRSNRIFTTANALLLIISVIVSASITYGLFNKNTLNTLFGLPKIWNAVLFGGLLVLATFIIFKLVNELVWHFIQKPNKGDIRDCRNDSQYGHHIFYKYLPPDKNQKRCWIRGCEDVESPSKELRIERVYNNQQCGSGCTPVGLTYFSEKSTLWLLELKHSDLQKAILGTYNKDYTNMTYKKVWFDKNTQKIITFPEAALSNIKNILCCRGSSRTSLTE